MSLLLETPSLLVALPQLQDPNFAKSVVLIVEHTDEGSMGFIINRPSPFSVRDVLQEAKREIPSDIPTWFGGPVGTEQGVVIHNQPDEEASARFGLIRISSSDSAMNGLLEPKEKHLEHYPYRFVIGYAGWGKGQLSQELKAGAWIQMEASFELLFNTPWPDMWEAAMGKIGVNPMDIAPTVQPYIN